MRLSSLALAQALAFIVLELVEHAASGKGLRGAVAETGLWWGLQLVVAWAAMVLLRISSAAGAAFVSSPSLSLTLRPSPVPAPTIGFSDHRPSASPASRGGPPLLARI